MAGGNVEFTNNFVAVRGAITAATERNVRQATAMLEGFVKQKLASGGRTGKEYKIPGTQNGKYTASAPGEAPAVMLSNYMNSITHQVASNPDEVTGTTGTNQKQGKRLEFGFVGVDSKGRRYNQAPRPHMKASYEENRSAIISKLSEGMDI